MKNKGATLARPDFLLIGAAKAGTTSLHAQLQVHPDVSLCDSKEPSFFSDDANYARGLEWYRSLFHGLPPGTLSGEASTRYSRWPHTADAAARIASALPRVKLVYLLRHPVERAYSHYVHHMRMGVTHSFEDALRLSQEYVDCSRYMMQIERYLRFFPPAALKIVFTDDLEQRPGHLLREVWEFLGVSETPNPRFRDVRVNRAGPEYLLRSRAGAWLEERPLLQQVARRLPRVWRRAAFRAFGWTPRARKLATLATPEPLSNVTRSALLKEFERPNRDLEDYLGRRLPESWWR